MTTDHTPFSLVTVDCRKSELSHDGAGGGIRWSTPQIQPASVRAV